MVNISEHIASENTRLINRYAVASQGKQVAASFIDAACVLVVWVASYVLSSNIMLSLLCACEVIVVCAIAEATYGITVGKACMGIRTVRAEGQSKEELPENHCTIPAGILRITIKYGIFIASFFAFIVGLPVVLCSPLFAKTPLLQGWADRAASLVQIDTKQVTIVAVQMHPSEHPGAHTTDDSLDVRVIPQSEQFTPIATPRIALANTQNPVLTQPIVSQPKAPQRSVSTQSVSQSTDNKSGNAVAVPAPSSTPMSSELATTPAANASTPSAMQQKLQKKAFMQRARGKHSAVSQSAMPQPNTLQTAQSKPAIPVPALPSVPAKPAVADYAQDKAMQATVIFADNSSVPVSVPSVLLLGRTPKGRHNEIPIVVPDTTGTVSRTHARLELTAHQWWITDLGSTNGTRILDSTGREYQLPAHERTTCEAGSRISLGDASCRIVMEHNGRKA